MPDHLENERIILSDAQGNYYLLSREMLESAKVTKEQAAEVEKVVNGGDDVGGFSAFDLRSGGQSLQLSAFGSQLQLRGSCACSFGCSTDLGGRVINPGRIG